MKAWFMSVAVMALLVGSAGAAADPSESVGAFGAAVTSFSLQDTEETSTAETTDVTSFSLGGPSYLLSSDPLFGDNEILWPGFLTGMRSKYSFHQKFAQPVGNPLYFESPFIESNARLIYVWHDFPSNSQLGGGELNVLALQARVAITDRLAFIATNNNYSWLDTGITPDGEGYGDIAAGLKYAFMIDEASEFVLTGGVRWELHNGARDVLAGGDSGHNELSPFISFAKGWDRFHLIGDLVYRAPMDRNDGNHILQWDLHADYEIAPEKLPGFFPFVELHALHYLSDADTLPLSVGGLDYTNLGSYDVAGSSVFWGDLGFRWKLTPNLSFGAAYGFPISNPGNDIFNQRVTLDFIFSF